MHKHHITDDRLAVGVSGGADSLALVLMLSDELKVYGKKIIALTVDHHLRPTSTAEAQYVAEIMQKFNIEHHILEWLGTKPQANVESQAREVRYDLLQKWCATHQVKCLFMAHHSQDQAETFLLRLQRGSGLDGLCAMREVSEWNGLTILRPLLSWSPQKLRAYLRARNIEWITDESNFDPKFGRNKLRLFLPQLAKETGISIARICQTAAHLQSAESYMRMQTEKLLARSVQQYSKTVVCFQYTEFLTWHPEMQFRILAHLCRQTYIPRAERVLRLISRMCHLPFNGATLGQKEIILANQTVWVVPEVRERILFKTKDWKDFAAQNPKYQNIKLPHKVKRALLLEKMHDL